MPRLQRRLKSPVLVEHVGEAARHAGGEVPAGAADDHHAPARHVLAPVVAHALHHGERAAVADREALARDAAEVGLAAGRAVEHHVADEDVLLGDEGRSRGGKTMILPPDSPLPT